MLIIVLVILWLFCGVIAGSIGFSRTGDQSAWWQYFLCGALLGIFGILIAAFAKRPVQAPPAAHPMPPTQRQPGWYPSVNNPGFMQWHTGNDWANQFQQITNSPS